MADAMTTKEASALWNISKRRINILCKEGRIPGAHKENNRWAIPANAKKPADKRYRNGTQPKAIPGKRLPLPIGISDYKKAATEYYYVDKTLMIRDFIDERPQVSLFTRPRRFGKTLNMDMLRSFFEKTSEDASVYFQDKKIWGCGDEYRAYQGKYPIIFLSFKDVKFDSWEKSYDSILELLKNEFGRHYNMLEDSRLNEIDGDCFRKMMTKSVSEAEAAGSLREFSGLRMKAFLVFGNQEIFNPWSVINYFSSGYCAQAYWRSTGSNAIIGEILSQATPEILQRLQSLIQGKSFLSRIDTDVIYPQIHKNPSSIYSFYWLQDI